MKITLVVVALLIAIGATWLMSHDGKGKAPLEITELQAQQAGEDARLEFCRSEGLNCQDFQAQGGVAPVDKRFAWAYRYIDYKTEPAVQLLVSVGKTGKTSVAFSPLESLPGA